MKVLAITDILHVKSRRCVPKCIRHTKQQQQSFTRWVFFSQISYIINCLKPQNIPPSFLTMAVNRHVKSITAQVSRKYEPQVILTYMTEKGSFLITYISGNVP
ncbi:hypothetical protein XENOCAPTIV_018190 [Xenoophorus captivus]|uniref:Uncharacterized protein n=1 Tax=Xenoophorus captivus TaxID=1517983 RepID=A0ABV0Q5E2_9TELE